MCANISKYLFQRNSVLFNFLSIKEYWKKNRKKKKQEKKEEKNPALIIIIINVSWAANQHIDFWRIMWHWRLSNDVENSALHHKYIFFLNIVK